MSENRYQFDINETTSLVVSLLRKGRPDVALGVAEILYSTGDGLALEPSREGLVSSTISELKAYLLEKPTKARSAIRWIMSDRGCKTQRTVFRMPQPEAPPQASLSPGDVRQLSTISNWLTRSSPESLLATVNFVYYDSLEPELGGRLPAGLLDGLVSSLCGIAGPRLEPLRHQLTGLLARLEGDGTRADDATAHIGHFPAKPLVDWTRPAATQAQNPRVDWRARGFEGSTLREMASRVDDLLGEWRVDVALMVSTMLHSAHNPSVSKMTRDALRLNIIDTVHRCLRNRDFAALRLRLSELMGGPDHQQGPGSRMTGASAKINGQILSDHDLVNRFTEWLDVSEPRSLLEAVNVVFYEAERWPLKVNALPPSLRQGLTRALRCCKGTDAQAVRERLFHYLCELDRPAGTAAAVHGRAKESDRDEEDAGNDAAVKCAATDSIEEEAMPEPTPDRRRIEDNPAPETGAGGTSSPPAPHPPERSGGTSGLSLPPDLTPDELRGASSILFDIENAEEFDELRILAIDLGLGWQMSEIEGDLEKAKGILLDTIQYVARDNRAWLADYAARIDAGNDAPEFSELLPITELLDQPADPRDHVFGPVLARGSVCVLSGPIASGKSSLALQIAAAVAAGAPWAGGDVPAATGVLLLIGAGRDPDETVRELRRRLQATVLHQRLESGAIRDNLHFADPRTFPCVSGDNVDQLIETVHNLQAGLLVIDPVGDATGSCREAGADFDAVLRLAADIAERGDCAVLLVDDTDAPAEAGGEAVDHRPEPEAPTAPHRSLVLSAMAPDECTDLGISPLDGRRYLHLSSGAGDPGVPPYWPQLFRRDSVELAGHGGCRVPVGVLSPTGTPGQRATSWNEVGGPYSAEPATRPPTAPFSPRPVKKATDADVEIANAIGALEVERISLSDAAKLLLENRPELFNGRPKLSLGRVPGAVTKSLLQAIERCPVIGNSTLEVTYQDGRGSGGKVRIISISR